MTDNQNLLAEFVQTGSDAAFRELVARYVDLVYSTALRLVEGDTHRAEDVAQTVFVDLARMARTLSPEVRLGGWLHRHTCFVAANLMRGERRRQIRERQAVEMNALQNNSRTDLSLVAPMLDEAINELDEADRTAILLRFFEQHDFRAVGQALGSNEDAARMRVTRALQKLESFLKRRGVTTTAASLGIVLSANAVQAAPVGLALTISTAAALAGTTIIPTATVTTIKTIAMTTLQKTLATVTIAAVLSTGIYEARQASQLRGQIQTLQQQHGPLTQQIKQLQEDAVARQAVLQQENERLRQTVAGVPKLRGEVAQLRTAQLQQQQLKTAGVDANDPATQQFLAAKKKGEQIARYMQQMPDKMIPEIKLLTDVDWLVATKAAKFDTDADIRQTLSNLRQLAKNRMPMGQALANFTQANNGQLPTDLAQLKPYFKSALGDSTLDDATLSTILARYKLLHTGNLGDLPPNTWIVAEIAPVDKDYDSRAKFGNGTSTIINNGTAGSYAEGENSETGVKP